MGQESHEQTLSPDGNVLVPLCACLDKLEFHHSFQGSSTISLLELPLAEARVRLEPASRDGCDEVKQAIGDAEIILAHGHARKNGVES